MYYKKKKKKLRPIYSNFDYVTDTNADVIRFFFASTCSLTLLVHLFQGKSIRNAEVMEGGAESALF